MIEYKKVELDFGLSTNNFVRTFVSDEEYTSIKESLDSNMKVVDKVKNKVNGKEIFVHVENIAERIHTDFESFTDEELKVLALKEFKTRSFQDTIRREFRQSHNLTASTATLTVEQRAIITDAKNSSPERQKAMLEFLKSYDVKASN